MVSSNSELRDGDNEPPGPTDSRSPSLMTLDEVIEELGVARSSFYEWRAKSTAPRCIKLPNGQLRIRRSELDSWLEALETE